MVPGSRFPVNWTTVLAALLMVAAATSSARADADFLSQHRGEFFCALKSSATGSLGSLNGVSTPQAPADSAAQLRQRTDQMQRDMERKEAAAKSAPLEARLSIVVRNGSAFLGLRFKDTLPQTVLQNFEINIVPATSASPTVRGASGELLGHTVLATATAKSFTAYWIEPEAPDGPVYRQIHLTTTAGTVDLAVWVIDSNGRRGTGRACVMERR